MLVNRRKWRKSTRLPKFILIENIFGCFSVVQFNFHGQIRPKFMMIMMKGNRKHVGIRKRKITLDVGRGVLLGRWEGKGERNSLLWGTQSQAAESEFTPQTMGSKCSCLLWVCRGWGWLIYASVIMEVCSWGTFQKRYKTKMQNFSKEVVRNLGEWSLNHRSTLRVQELEVRDQKAHYKGESSWGTVMVRMFPFIPGDYLKNLICFTWSLKTTMAWGLVPSWRKGDQLLGWRELELACIPTVLWGKDCVSYCGRRRDDWKTCSSSLWKWCQQTALSRQSPQGLFWLKRVDTWLLQGYKAPAPHPKLGQLYRTISASELPGWLMSPLRLQQSSTSPAAQFCFFPSLSIGVDPKGTP